MNELRTIIIRQASKLSYTVADLAPGDQRSVFEQGSHIKVWAGESDNTIWGDASVNHAFRAIHDLGHIKSGLGFTPDAEIELGRLQASKYTGILADIVYLEVAGQAKYYKETGLFLLDQREFVLSQLKGKL